MRFKSLLLAFALWPAAAHAEWLEASSAHFVVLTDDNESNARRFSAQLERYNAAMALLTGQEITSPSPSNRVTVHVVRNERAVRELHGGQDKYVAGFYRPRAGNSQAVVPEITAANGRSSFSMIILLHEYAHHFLISGGNSSLPRWLSEGAAEFFASTSFDASGGISIGRPAQHRAGELFNARDVKAADLLDPAAYDTRPKRSYDAFYGKSWLLYHFLTFENARAGQLHTYVNLLTQGKGMREAGLEAFGDFDKLERDLDNYLARSRMSAFNFKPGMLAIGPTAIRRLSAGEAAIMPVRVRSSLGVNAEQAQALLGQARTIAARYPADAAVLSALAEAEHDAGNDKEAIAAADAALKSDPGQVNAYIQKGYALFRMAETADDRAAAFSKARTPFLALNARENDHPIPLMYYYRSYVQQGREPPPVAIDGLVRAMQLAPFDLGLRMTVATALIRKGRLDEARIALRPIAFDPHGKGFSEAARRVIARIDGEPDWRGKGLEAMMAGAEPDGE